ncbi:MAG: HD-GYP domain-containing protein [Chloroflexi bacterium]|nr:HD-GYP domain-containing protein [Chloroflexota bacterium]
MERIRHFFFPTISLSTGFTYRTRFLEVSLWATAIACLLFAGLNYSGEFSRIVQVFLGISLLSLWGLWLNRRGRFTPAAALLVALVFMGLNFNLYDSGGLEDPGIAAYPIFILLCGFLFGRVSIPPALILDLASLGWLYFGPRWGWFALASLPSDDRVMVLAVLCGVTALVAWVLIDAWESTLENLRQTYEQTLAGWAKALELRHQETEGHSRRVTALALELSRALGLKGATLEEVRQGALLHDVGKMGIPDSILLKPGPLTEEEFDVVKRHPALAADLLGHIPFLQSVLDIPWYHHERWDGNGYPKGLKGEAIPFVARLFAVIDNWDALNSDRPYRRAWTREQVLTYLRENAGHKFDPHVVEAFLRLVELRPEL